MNTKNTGAINKLLIRLKLAMLIAVALSTANIEAYAQCSPQAVFEMQRRGFPQWQIDKICGVYQHQPAPFPNIGSPAPMSVRCLSQAGTCSMRQPGPIGAPCWCQTPFGPSPGIVR